MVTWIYNQQLPGEPQTLRGMGRLRCKNPLSLLQLSFVDEQNYPLYLQPGYNIQIQISVSPDTAYEQQREEQQQKAQQLQQQLQQQNAPVEKPQKSNEEKILDELRNIYKAIMEPQKIKEKKERAHMRYLIKKQSQALHTIYKIKNTKQLKGLSQDKMDELNVKLEKVTKQLSDIKSKLPHKYYDKIKTDFRKFAEEKEQQYEKLKQEPPKTENKQEIEQYATAIQDIQEDMFEDANQSDVQEALEDIPSFIGEWSYNSPIQSQIEISSEEEDPQAEQKFYESLIKPEYQKDVPPADVSYMFPKKKTYAARLQETYIEKEE